MFELHHVMTTLMERARCLTDARNSQLPPSFLQKYPLHVSNHCSSLSLSPSAQIYISECFFSTFYVKAKYITRMLSSDPKDRPTVSEVLEGELFKSKDDVSSSILSRVTKLPATYIPNHPVCKLIIYITDD